MEEKKLTIPTGKIEDTLGGGQTGGNFYFGDNEKQGKLNAQVGTGAMAGIPKIETPAQQEQQTGKRFDLQHKSIELPEKQTTQQEATATNTNTGSTAKTGAKNTTAQTQQTTQPEGFRENGVRYKDATDRNTKTNGAEFGGLQNALPKEETTVEEKVEEKTEEPAGQDVNVNTFLQGSTTELFGKMISGADTAPYDHNSIEWKKAEARLAQYQKINALSVSQLASNINSGSILAGGQAMRDLQTYNPEKYQQLQEYQKKEDSLNQINMIASGKTEGDTTLQSKTGESINNYLNETVANAGGNSLDRASLDEALSQNQGIINYAERMSYYSSKITELDQTIGDLEADARKKLGADVPEYMIQNYVNNRSKKLYKQRDNLMNQYNYYKGVYEAQVEQEATKWERDYKERQLKLQENKAIRDQAMDQANLDLKNQQLNYDYYKLNASSPVSESAVQGGMTSYIDSIQDKIANHAKIRSGGCGTVVNDYLSSLGVKFQYDDNKSTKLNSITPGAGPKVGSIAVWESTGTTDGNKYGHVAIVTGVNKDGTITVLESNKDTGLRYHNYKQSNVTGYYDPSAGSKSTTTSKSSSSKDKTYTNDELYAQLRGGKIKRDTGTDGFLKNWNGDETKNEIESWVADKYLNQASMVFDRDMISAVNDLKDMIGDSVAAERQTLNYMNKNNNIKNPGIVRMIYKYIDDLTDNSNREVSVSEFLSEALLDRVKSKEDIKKLLDDSKLDFKGLTGVKNKKLAEATWEKVQEKKES